MSIMSRIRDEMDAAVKIDEDIPVPERHMTELDCLIMYHVIEEPKGRRCEVDRLAYRNYVANLNA